MLTLGFAIVAVIVINAVFTFIQEYRAEKALEALKTLLPFNVKTIRSGKESEGSAEEVVPGDLIRLAEGDKVPGIVAAIAAVVGVFFFILGFAIGRTFWANFIFAIGITVAPLSPKACSRLLR